MHTYNRQGELPSQGPLGLAFLMWSMKMVSEKNQSLGGSVIMHGRASVGWVLGMKT